MRWCTYFLIYLLTQLARAHKTGNNSETVEDRAKVTINGLYKVVHGLSIAAKMYDLEWRMSEIQGHSLNAAKIAKWRLRRRVKWLDALYLSGVCRYSCAYLLIYLLTHTVDSGPRRGYKTGNIYETVYWGVTTKLYVLSGVIAIFGLPSLVNYRLIIRGCFGVIVRIS